MKNKLKLVLSLVLLLPILLLAACDVTQYYTITCLSSDETLGIANGGSDVAKAEGTAISLSVTELSPQSHPFVCWIKDYSKIVSFENNYSTTYSAQTQGSYTAFFEEDVSNVGYAIITDISIEGVDSGTIQIQYANSNSSTNYRTLENLSFDDGAGQTDRSNLIYFGGASGSDGRNEFIFRAIITVPTSSGGTTNYTIMFDSTLIGFSTAGQGQASFDSQGQCILTGTNSNNIEISISFSKLSNALFEE